MACILSSLARRLPLRPLSTRLAPLPPPLVFQRTIIVLDPNDVRLDNLRDNPGAIKKSVRLGRGIGTGTGKTSGRGHKGQHSRSGTGKPGPGREGGQSQIYRTLRKYGFKNTRFERKFTPLNLEVLQHHINNKTINPYKPITIKEIFDANCVGKHFKNGGVKLLARGIEKLTTPNLHVQVSDCSSVARDAIEKLGGKVELVYHNRLSMRYTIRPEKFFLKPTFARPPPKLHQSKYPTFPEPTSFKSDPAALENLQYAPDFDDKRRQRLKDAREAKRFEMKGKRKTRKQVRRERAIDAANAAGAKRRTTTARA